MNDESIAAEIERGLFRSIKEHSTAELIAAVHERVGYVGMTDDQAAVFTKAADRLAELDALVAQATRVIKDRDDWNDSLVADAADVQERIDALRPPCPTCGGDGETDDVEQPTFPHCPDCTDGKVSIEQLVATYNAVHQWEPFPQLANYRPERGGAIADVYAYLRAVKP